MKRMKSVHFFWGTIAVLIVLGVASSLYVSSQPGKLDTFAQCLKDKGAVFYGAFWCPHCKATKALFGSSVKYLPYVECSTPDGKGQTQVCIDKKIESYPTWVFPSGVVKSGELTLQELSELSSCPLPQ